MAAQPAAQWRAARAFQRDSLIALCTKWGFESERVTNMAINIDASGTPFLEVSIMMTDHMMDDVNELFAQRNMVDML